MMYIPIRLFSVNLKHMDWLPHRDVLDRRIVPLFIILAVRLIFVFDILLPVIVFIIWRIELWIFFDRFEPRWDHHYHVVIFIARVVALLWSVGCHPYAHKGVSYDYA